MELHFALAAIVEVQERIKIPWLIAKNPFLNKIKKLKAPKRYNPLHDINSLSGLFASPNTVRHWMKIIHHAHNTTGTPNNKRT